MRESRGEGAALPWLAIVLIIIVIIAVVGMALFIPWKVTEVDESRSVSVIEGTEEIDLNLDQDVGKVAVHFSSEAQDLVLMTVEGKVRQNMLSSGDPVTITWTANFVGARLVLSADIDADAYSTTYGSEELVTTITIPLQLSALVNVTGATGTTELVAGNDVMLRGGQLSETAGSVHVSLAGCSLMGALNIEATTGSCKLDWTEVAVLDGTEVTVSSTAGGVELNVVQTTSLGGNASISAGANTGGVELDLSIEGGISSRVASTTEVGSVSVESSTGFTGSDEDLRSNNYPSQEMLDFSVDTNVGGIELDLQYLV